MESDRQVRSWRRSLVLGAVVAAAVGLAGCSGSHGPGAVVSPSASASPTVGSWSVWQKKILAASNAGSSDVCVDVTAAACLPYVEGQVEPVDDLRDAVVTAHVSGKYPQMMSLIREIDTAIGTFEAGSCTDVEGSPCFEAVTTIMDDSMDLSNMLPDPR